MLGVSPIVPAYGRDYRSLAAAQADLDAGRDFVTPGGQYIGREQLLRLGMAAVAVRYGHLRKVGMMKVRPAQEGKP